MGYEQILFEADKISTVRGDDIEVLPEVVFGRDALQAKLGWGRNDPKVGVRNFTINGPNIHVCLATGIYATDDKWSQEINYSEHGSSTEVFRLTHGLESEEGLTVHYYAMLDIGAYVHFSTFALAIGIDSSREFNDTYALIVQKQKGQQTGSISLANQGVEVMQRKAGCEIEDISLATNDFRRAVKYDACATLKLEEEQVVGYQDMGIALMPGSMDAGGLVVVRIDADKLAEAYAAGSNWKKPLIVPTAELSDRLKSGFDGMNINSLLGKESLGIIIHNEARFKDCYERALSNGIGF